MNADSPRIRSRLFEVAFPALVLWAVTAFSVRAEAQFFTGPVASAAGGAGRAAVDPSEASFLNPAALVHLGRYYVSGLHGFGEASGERDLREFGVLLADGSSGNLFAGSVSYIQRQVEGGETAFDEQGLAVSLAGLVLPQLAAGLTYQRLQYDRAGAAGLTQNNGHLGLLYTVNGKLGLGAVVSNFLSSDADVPEAVRAVRSYAVGVNALLTGHFRWRLDLVRPDELNEHDRINTMTGIETYFTSNWVFRLGSQWRETVGERDLTAGFGYNGPRLSFDYAYQQEVRDSRGFRHLFDLRLPF